MKLRLCSLKEVSRGVARSTIKVSHYLQIPRKHSQTDKHKRLLQLEKQGLKRHPCFPITYRNTQTIENAVHFFTSF